MCVIVISHVAEIIKFQVTSAEQTNTKFIVSPRQHIKNGPNPVLFIVVRFIKLCLDCKFILKRICDFCFLFFLPSALFGHLKAWNLPQGSVQ